LILLVDLPLRRHSRSGCENTIRTLTGRTQDSGRTYTINTIGSGQFQHRLIWRMPESLNPRDDGPSPSGSPANWTEARGPFPGAVYELRVIHVGLSVFQAWAGLPDVRYWNWSRQMSSVQIEQKSYEMPPREGISIAHFLTVADVERSARYYEKVFGARILSLGDGNAPGYLQLANIWMILNVGGGPTPDKPTVTLSVPDPNHINSFMNFRVADIQACYELWKSRGAKFITEPIPKYGETRCYIRDPDGYIIEVGQSTDLTYG
jgi:catechol 2,3-dioxygenase-like lactoylglutathione lyase family enzyme